MGLSLRSGGHLKHGCVKVIEAVGPSPHPSLAMKRALAPPSGITTTSGGCRPLRSISSRCPTRCAPFRPPSLLLPHPRPPASPHSTLPLPLPVTPPAPLPPRPPLSRQPSKTKLCSALRLPPYTHAGARSRNAPIDPRSTRTHASTRAPAHARPQGLTLVRPKPPIRPSPTHPHPTPHTPVPPPRYLPPPA
jgi:hypothetical protein